MLNSQLKRGTLELCVLAIVDRNDCYGYELVSQISEYMQVTEGTIYPLLKRLKDNGSIISYIVESQEGPPRKYYSITDDGKTERQQQEGEWRSFVGGVESILTGNKKANERRESQS
ncbi:transcriptional regulator [Clostridia bacterium]|nr:transcriptional regulator [Clostridia bacterium]